jgi:hypothetical protein
MLISNRDQVLGFMASLRVSIRFLPMPSVAFGAFAAYTAGDVTQILTATPPPKPHLVCWRTHI